ncbi:MAG TPA: hypothetical protein VJL58_10265 [Pyrinomonadaceae bacterium]|nr:hypothetical protein [Pyrinomonadaceae bacterium]
MPGFEQTFTEFIRAEVAACIAASVTTEPDLIDLKEAAEVCRCGVDTINNLFAARDANGFPGVALGPKTLRVDRVRLNAWLASGGLREDVQTDETANVTPKLRAVK